MIALDAALALLLADVEPLDGEEVRLDLASGRTLASDLDAMHDQPMLRASAMDGYAIIAADFVAGAKLTVVGTSYAGAPFMGTIGAGQAVRIATGGVLPDGAERVVMQEIVQRDGNAITIEGPLHDAHFIRAAGGDYRAGDPLIAQGEQLTSARIGLAASAGRATLAVRRHPRIAIFTSGDELRQPGETLRPGDVVDSAGIAMASLVATWGGIADRRAVLPDDHEVAKAIIGSGEPADVMLFIGGASVGDRDVLRGVVGDLGARILFDRIAVQPGKPCWHARFDDGRIMLGLPGNPASAFVCAHLLLRPLIDAMLGRQVRAARFARLATAIASSGERETYWRATVTADACGQAVVTADPSRDSSLQRPLARANALVRQPAATALAVGEPAEIILID